MSRPEKIYLTWTEPDDPDEYGFFSIYDTLAEAVSDGNAHREIFVARPRRVGKFKMVTRPVRVKARRKK